MGQDRFARMVHHTFLLQREAMPLTFGDEISEIFMWYFPENNVVNSDSKMEVHHTLGGVSKLKGR